MSDLQVFNNPDFGDIRTITEDSKTLFCGKDVATALGYRSPKDAISAHCKGAVIRRPLTNGGVQDMKFIPIGDVFRLAAKSELPGAEKFESWIFDEVLPSIHERGAYIAPQAQSQGLEPFAAALETLTAAVQALTQRMDQQDQGPRKALPPPRALDEDNPLDDCPVPIKPPSNKMRRQWMRTASDKLNALADKCGIPSSSVLHALYRELEEDEGVILSEVRLKALEEHQLTDCSVLLAIFYDANLRRWFEDRVDQYLIQDTPAW